MKIEDTEEKVNCGVLLVFGYLVSKKLQKLDNSSIELYNNKSLAWVPFFSKAKLNFGVLFNLLLFGE